MKIFSLVLVFLLLFGVVSCNKTRQADSPKDVFQKFLIAKADKDAETVKKLVSRNFLQMVEKEAEQQGTTVEELLKVDTQSFANQSLELGDEKISGDTASVEVKNPRTGEWEKIPFVKENGEWKIAFDVAIKEAEQKFRERIRNSPDEPSNSNVDSNGNQK